MTTIILKPEFLKGQKPNIELTKGVWVAGGAVRQWFLGNENPSDIDVFSSSKELLDQFAKEKLANCKIISESAQQKTYEKDDQWIQLIYGRLFPNINETFDNFDYTLCQFAWDGEEVYGTLEAVISVLTKHLAIHKITKEFATDSLRRAFKYHSKGYEPCLGTIRDLALSFQNLTAEEINNSIEISPGGGRRGVRFD